MPNRRAVLLLCASFVSSAACGRTASDVDTRSSGEPPDDLDAGASPLAVVPPADGTRAVVRDGIDGASFERQFDYDWIKVATYGNRMYVAGIRTATNALAGGAIGSGAGVIAELDPSGAVRWETPIAGEWPHFGAFVATEEGLWLAMDAAGEVRFGSVLASTGPPGPLNAKHFFASIDAEHGAVRWVRELRLPRQDALTADVRSGVWALVEGGAAARGCSASPLRLLLNGDAESTDCAEHLDPSRADMAMARSGELFLGGSFVEDAPDVAPVRFGDVGTDVDTRETTGIVFGSSPAGGDWFATLSGASVRKLAPVSAGLFVAGALSGAEDAAGVVRIAGARFEAGPSGSHATVLSLEGEHRYSRAFQAPIWIAAVSPEGGVLFSATTGADASLTQGLAFAEGTRLFGVLSAEDEAAVRWVRTGRDLQSAAPLPGGGWLVSLTEPGSALGEEPARPQRASVVLIQD